MPPSASIRKYFPLILYIWGPSIQIGFPPGAHLCLPVFCEVQLFYPILHQTLVCGLCDARYTQVYNPEHHHYLQYKLSHLHQKERRIYSAHFRQHNRIRPFSKRILSFHKEITGSYIGGYHIISLIVGII